MDTILNNTIYEILVPVTLHSYAEGKMRQTENPQINLELEKQIKGIKRVSLGGKIGRDKSSWNTKTFIIINTSGDLLVEGAISD